MDPQFNVFCYIIRRISIDEAKVTVLKAKNNKLVYLILEEALGCLQHIESIVEQGESLLFHNVG